MKQLMIIISNIFLPGSYTSLSAASLSDKLVKAAHDRTASLVIYNRRCEKIPYPITGHYRYFPDQ